MKPSLLGFASLLLFACDPSTMDGGDINGTDSGSGSGSEGTTSPGSDTQSSASSGTATTASSTATDSSNATDGPDTDSPSGSSTVGDTEGDTDGAGLCVDFTPPPRGCDGPGDANVFVDLFDFPQGVKSLDCSSASVENIDATTDRVVLACEGLEDPISFTVMTENPHLELPLDTTNVVIDTDEAFGSVGQPTLVIRSSDGDILFASVDGNDQSGSPWMSPLLSPFQVTMIGSGCPGYAVHEKCPAGQEITAQRAALDMSLDGASVTIYSRNQATLGAYAVIVAASQHIVCWDEDCSGDDSGPFDEARFVLVRTPGA